MLSIFAFQVLSNSESLINFGYKYRNKILSNLIITWTQENQVKMQNCKSSWERLTLQMHQDIAKCAVGNFPGSFFVGSYVAISCNWSWKQTTWDCVETLMYIGGHETIDVCGSENNAMTRLAPGPRSFGHLTRRFGKINQSFQAHLSPASWYFW